MRPPTPGLGALPDGTGVRFRIWAPDVQRLELVVESRGAFAMHPQDGGYWEAYIPGLSHGALYRYRLDGGPLWPDPASRFQPAGVHGSSMVVDPRRYRWGDEGWTGVPQERLVFYELNVGAFAPEGTFEGVGRRLPYLRDLGVTAVELMPVAEFPGRRNWGYDPAALYAPSHAYGTPDDLHRLVDEAHRLRLAVFLDVVYNHFGPDGAYAPAFAPAFSSARHRTPWGPAINLDGPGAAGVRAFFIDNALHWLREYHLDGLRLDATHALADESPVPFLRELADAVRTLPEPPRFLVAEDHRNLNRLVLPRDAGGLELHAVWSDDYHHQVRRLLAGDRDGYFADFGDSTTDLATIIRQGWLFTGQWSTYFGAPRGTDPAGIPLHRVVHFLQNHDQVGNRPRGDRLTAAIPLHVFRAASAALLFAPALPLLFMGQEWAAGSPFRYFTDHHPELGRRVREGRRREFSRFAGFAGEIPDPQAAETFLASRLDWAEPGREPHAGVQRLYRDLLALRPRLGGDPDAHSPVERGLVLRRGRHALVAAFRDGLILPRSAGRPILSTEEDRYALDPAPPHVGGDAVRFARAAAVVFEGPSA